VSSGIRARLEEALREGQCSNHGLALDRFVGGFTPEEREALLSSVSGLALPPLYALFFRRWKAAIEDLGHRSGHVASRELVVQDRLIVGLASGNVLEASIRLHRTCGAPFIPGSALKGIARHHLRSARETSSWTEHDEILFGHQESGGHVTFFDALYVPGTTREDKPLRPDVMTPHHPGYYSTRGKSSPTDFDDPTPVSFLSAVGNYWVAVIAPDQEWSSFTLALLEAALASRGAGGKTSSGYGRLVPADARASAAFSSQRGPAGIEGPGVRLAREIRALSREQVKPQINQFLERWTRIDDAGERVEPARALLEKAREAGIKNKPWIREVQAVLEPH